MNHTSDHTRAQDAQCTCHWPPARYAGPGFGLGPDCPRHGIEAILQHADQELDIDTSYQEVATRHE